MISTANGIEFSRQEKIFTMVGALLGLLLAALDQTIVATAGPAIQKDLQIEPSLYVWITTSYLVASTVLVPIYGKLSDLFGRRKILAVGIGIFLLGSLLCGVAQTSVQLILYRALQGMGSAALFTSAFAVVADIFPPAERGKYQGIFGAVFGFSSVVGPLLGGFITDHVGWHWVFFVNLPVGALALLFIFTRMPPLHFSQGRRASIDVAGALVLIIAVVPLLLALSLGRNHLAPGETGFLWGSWQILGMFGLSLVGLLLFVFVELRAENPILDLRLFSNRAFAIGNLAAFVTGAAFLGAIVFLPLFMVNVVGLSATRSGLTTTPLTMGVVLGNIISGQLVSRVGKYKIFILGSLMILVGGFAVMGFTLSPSSTQMSVTLKMILVGIGLGPSIPLFTLAIQNSVPPQQIGVATSAATFFRSMGSTVGLAVLGTVFATSLTSGMRTQVAEATRDVPPQLAAQFAPGARGAVGEEGAPTGEAFNAAAVKAQVHEAFTRQRDLVERALLKGDEQALAALRADPRVDARLKEALDASAWVAPGYVHSRQRVEAALAAGTEDAFQALTRDPALPEEIRGALARAAPEGREQALRGALEGLSRREVVAQEEAMAGALRGALAGLQQAEERALATVDRVGGAIKQAFSDAIADIYRIALVIALLGFLITLVLPELPLRRGPVRPPVAE